MKLHWTTEQIEAAKEVLRRTPLNQYHAALDEIALVTRRVVSDYNLRHAFQRRGLPTPTSFCVAPMQPGATRATSHKVATPAPPAAPNTDKGGPHTGLLVDVLKQAGGRMGLTEFCDQVDLSPTRARSLTERAQQQGVRVRIEGDHVELLPEPPPPSPRTPIRPPAMTADRTYVDKKSEPTPRGVAALERILIIPDTHRPFHDEDAWQIMLRAAKVLKPRHLVILGDFADFYSISAHDKDPGRATDMQDEIESVNEGLDQLDVVGAAHKYYIAGNHEYRLQRFLATEAPAMYRMMSVPELLKLEERGWKYTPYREWVQIGKLYLTHDTGHAGMYAHIRARDAFEATVGIGHVHRAGIHYSGSARGQMHAGASFGWLGSMKFADYMHKIVATRAWCHAFGAGYLEADTGNVHLQVIPIIEGRCVVDGLLIQ